MASNQEKCAKKVFNKNCKKDTNGLFNGGFKSQEFLTEEEKQERRRKRTQDWLSEVEEEYEDA